VSDTAELLKSRLVRIQELEAQVESLHRVAVAREQEYSEYRTRWGRGRVADLEDSLKKALSAPERLTIEMENLAAENRRVLKQFEEVSKLCEDKTRHEVAQAKEIAQLTKELKAEKELTVDLGRALKTNLKRHNALKTTTLTLIGLIYELANAPSEKQA